jgi:hypothetical protein
MKRWRTGPRSQAAGSSTTIGMSRVMRLRASSEKELPSTERRQMKMWEA